MPQSLSQVWLHIVFSTKGRQTFLQDTEFREELFRMLSHHVEKIGCFPRRSGGWIEHVHIVCGLSRAIGIPARREPVGPKLKYPTIAKSAQAEHSRTLHYDGWGIHFSIQVGWVWNLWGRACVVVRFKNGGTLRPARTMPRNERAF